MLDLSACADLRWLANVVADIAATGLAQRPILVGALARDILLLHAHGIDTGRATEDAKEFNTESLGGLISFLLEALSDRMERSRGRPTLTQS